MADYKALIEGIVANVFTNLLPGLTVEITVRYFVSAGEYDEELDTINPIYRDKVCKNVVLAKPIFADVTERGAMFSDTKLIIPGLSLPDGMPDADTDRVLMPDGIEWNVRKTLGVPGDGAFFLFVNR